MIVSLLATSKYVYSLCLLLHVEPTATAPRGVTRLVGWAKTFIGQFENFKCDGIAR